MVDIKKHVEDITTTLLDKLGIIHNGVEENKVSGQTLYCINVDAVESEFLIGERDDVLRAINMLVSRMLENKINERNRITIDVNDYKKKKIDTVVEHAKAQADKVKELKHEVELQPANGYERMLVHAALADDVELETGSIGEGADRRVVIKFVG